MQQSSKTLSRFVSRENIEKLIESVPISFQEIFWHQILEKLILRETCILNEDYYELIGGVINVNSR